MVYYGGITAEPFLFYEIRVAAKFFLAGDSLDEAVKKIADDNLFQFPTERSVRRIVKSCYDRLAALESRQLQELLAEGPAAIAKQVNLYAMMRWNRIVWDFMVEVIGAKYKSMNLVFERKDINRFFSDLQVENEDVGKWSEGTIKKIISELIKFLFEAGYIDTIKSNKLNPILISEELEMGIKDNKDFEALAAFNCLR